MSNKYLLVGAGVAVAVFWWMRSRQQAPSIQRGVVVADTMGQRWAIAPGKNGFYYDNQGRMWT